MKQIDRKSRVPLYAQLMDIILFDIDNNLVENEKMMSEREYCEIYNVSRTTIRQAFDELEKEKRIYKLHGKGIFVAPRILNQDLTHFYSFTEEMKKLGKVPSSDIISFELLEADENIQSKFNTENNIFYKIARIRKADNIPMIYEVSYLPFERFNNLQKEDLEKNPMYKVLKDKFNLNIDRANEEFQPVLASRIESLYLNIEKDSPSLKIERFSYENNTLIEYTVSVSRGDKFKYRITLKN